MSISQLETIEIPVEGMDCAECTMHVKKAISGLPGVESAEVFLASEKAIIHLDPQMVSLLDVRKAVKQAGYSVPEKEDPSMEKNAAETFTRPIMIILGVLFAVVLFVVVAGEWLGLFELVTGNVPWLVGLALVLVGGYPVFREVVRAALRSQVIAHTLMTVGVIAALVVGEWVTAAVVVFFMRVGDYVERFTTERARRAVKDLTALAPKMARVERDGLEVLVPVEQVAVGEIVVVRPGDEIPVDGEVAAGHATVDQANITGEAMPVEAGPGARVFAATLVRLGSLRLRTTRVGADTTFGRVIRLVEDAEAHRADVQRVADKFSAMYLPVVAGIAAITFILRRDPLATAAVLVVACSCAFALATPIAMLASIGAGARRGLMIKGGKYLELLDKASVLLIDKTGTLTLGSPEIVDFRILRDDWVPGRDGETEMLRLAASAEKYSEHPLAEAVREAARQRRLELDEPQDFEAIPGLGVRATVQGQHVEVGNRRMFSDVGERNGNVAKIMEAYEAQGKATLLVTLDDQPLGLMAASDTLRSDAPTAIQMMRSFGVDKVELLTGDNERAAAALIEQLGHRVDGGLDLKYRADMLPEDKIEVVKEYQAQGHTVVMVGDGVNDAPALAQADVGIAMGAAGSDVAVEAAHVALMRDDWSLVPDVFLIAKRTVRVVKMNIAFTALYNLVGLTLAALGYLPPVLAAAAQSLPDLGILANSSRLLRQK